MAWIQSLFSGQNPAMTLVWLFLAVAVLLIASFWLFRKIAGGGSLKTNRNRQPRLSVTDAAVVDEKRRLVLVRRDNVEHLVMIGGLTDFVIEQNIVRTHLAAAQSRDVPQAEQQFATKPAEAGSQNTRIANAPGKLQIDAARQPEAQQARSNGAAVPVAASAAKGGARGIDPAILSVPSAPLVKTRLPVASAPEFADFELDLAGELQRDLIEGQFTPESLAPGVGPGSEAAAPESDEIDFAKLLGEPGAAEPGFPDPAPLKPRKQQKADDEMQRMLDELANA